MELQLGVHRNKALMADWLHYAESQFAFEVLEQIQERFKADFDCATELARCMAAWRATIPSDRRAPTHKLVLHTKAKNAFTDARGFPPFFNASREGPMRSSRGSA
jgi:hypothetical protein